MPTNFFSRLIFNKGWLSTDLDVFICFQPAFFEPKSNFLKNEGIENLGMSTISLSVYLNYLITIYQWLFMCKSILTCSKSPPPCGGQYPSPARARCPWLFCLYIVSDRLTSVLVHSPSCSAGGGPDEDWLCWRYSSLHHIWWGSGCLSSTLSGGSLHSCSYLQCGERSGRCVSSCGDTRGYSLTGDPHHWQYWGRHERSRCF